MLGVSPLFPGPLVKGQIRNNFLTTKKLTLNSFHRSGRDRSRGLRLKTGLEGQGPQREREPGAGFWTWAVQYHAGWTRLGKGGTGGGGILASSISFSLGEMTVKLHPPSRIRARKDSWEHWGFTLFFSKGVKFKSFLRYWPGWMKKSWIYEDPLPWQGLARRNTVEEGLSVVKYIPNHVPGSPKGTHLVLFAWEYGGLLFARSSVFEA